MNEDLQAKLKRMPEDARRKLQETLTRIINEGSGDSSASFCDADIIERAPDSSGALLTIPACPGGAGKRPTRPVYVRPTTTKGTKRRRTAQGLGIPVQMSQRHP